ncbi:hypothetical protein D9M69_560980 [compost metagenome]
MGRAQIAGEDHALLFAGLGIVQVDFQVGRVEDMSGALQADAADQALRVMQGEPGLAGQGDDALLD